MGGGGGDAAGDARRAEEERQAQVAATQRRIESIFSTPEREQDINKFLEATRGYYRTDADRQQGDAARSLRFALARSGTTGGSYDADTNARLYETYQRGLLEADRRAQAAAQGLRTADQDAKQRLFSLAQSGLDATTATQQASQALRNNIGQAAVDAREGTLGNLFSNFGDIYKNSIEQSEQRKTQKDIYNTLYAPSQYGSGYKGGGGG